MEELKTLLIANRGEIAVGLGSTFAPGSNFDKKTIALVDAAIEAGVPYFIPSEWAMDTAGIMGSTNNRYGPTLPTNMVLAPKRVSHNYLLCRAAEGKIKFAALYPGVLVEVCLKNRMFRFDVSKKLALLPDGGINPFPASTLTSVAKAVTTFFLDPELISNRFYHISDGVLTQRDILHFIEEEAGTKWKVEAFGIAESRESALRNMAAGVFGMREWFDSLTEPFFGGMQVWTHVDNDVLGVGEREDLKEAVLKVVREKL